MDKIYFNHTAHKALWCWLSENPSKDVQEWVGWTDTKKERLSVICFYEDVKITSGNFACDYAKKISSLKVPDCAKCPFGNFSNCACLDGLLRDQIIESLNGNYEVASYKAKQIAELQLRSDIFIDVI